jgi:hypothetical protein
VAESKNVETIGFNENFKSKTVPKIDNGKFTKNKYPKQAYPSPRVNTPRDIGEIRSAINECIFEAQQ